MKDVSDLEDEEVVARVVDRVLTKLRSIRRGQHEMGRLTGINQSTLSRLITGDRQPNDQQIFRLLLGLADEFGLPWADGDPAAEREAAGDAGVTIRLGEAEQIAWDLMARIGGPRPASLILMEHLRRGVPVPGAAPARRPEPDPAGGADGSPPPAAPPPPVALGAAPPAEVAAALRAPLLRRPGAGVGAKRPPARRPFGPGSGTSKKRSR